MSIPPIEPPEFPPENPPPGQLPGLGTFLRKRYTCNVTVNEDMSANDLLHEVIFTTSRHFFTQGSTGAIALRSKKPVPYAFVTEALSVDETVLDVDNVKEWIGNVDNWLLIQPHTAQSEIRRVTAAAYSTSANSFALSSTGGLFSITGFSGCDGASTPATGTISVTSASVVDCTITVDTVTFAFRTSSGDTTESIASFIAGMIASHPKLYRRFSAAWAAGDTQVVITPRVGTLTIDSGLDYASDAPVADPTTAPTLTAAASGSLAAGDYAVSYAWVDANGNETLISPFQDVTLTANQKIDVTAITPLPTGAVSVKWYVSPAADSTKIRYISTNNGSAFTINALPLLTAPLPPDLNRTGTEVMTVAAVFSDREETRSALSRSNVLKATYSWLLGNRSKPINRVDLKYRDASDDWRLIELRLRDDAHIAKTKKISKLEINGQAIDNTDQAYRIAAGLLAERRDADFFYKWEATREALLLQEGDVVAITDGGSGVVNLPVVIEEIDIDASTGSLPKIEFTARKYASTLYDDSIVERSIPVVV